ncbi:MAG TPA: hypothetical protein DCK99_03935 [Blastocatellia bacterium]|nr:hypothetical protein [Blastocatellia bacterium]
MYPRGGHVWLAGVASIGSRQTKMRAYKNQLPICGAVLPCYQERTTVCVESNLERKRTLAIFLQLLQTCQGEKRLTSKRNSPPKASAPAS